MCIWLVWCSHRNSFSEKHRSCRHPLTSHLPTCHLLHKSSAQFLTRCCLELFLRVLPCWSQAWLRGHKPIPSCWEKWLLSAPRCLRWRGGSSRSSPWRGCYTGTAAGWTLAPSGSCCWGSRTPRGWCRWRPSLSSDRRRRWRRAGSRGAPGGASQTAYWRRSAAASTERTRRRWLTA